jgi:hypothetical protein
MTTARKLLTSKVLLVLLIAGIALYYRWKGVLHIPLAQMTWTTENERVAASLISGRGFADPYGSETGPTAHVAPLYPFLLSGIYAVLGDIQTPSGRLAQQALTIAVSIVILLLLPGLARRLGLHPVAGWLAALLVAWLPANRDDEVTGHFEQVVATLLLLGCLWFFSVARSQQWRGRSRWLTAFLFAALALCAPNLALIPMVLFAGEIIAARADQRRQALRACFLCASVCALAVAPWLLRNCLVLGGFVPVRSNFGLELAVGNHPGADGHTFGPGYDEIHPTINPEECELVRTLGELAYMDCKRRQAMAWIGSNPATFAYLTLKRGLFYWFTPDEQWYELSLRLHRKSRIYGLLGLLVIIELIRLCRRKHSGGWLLLAVFIATMMPYLPTHVDMRYRYPIVPLSALLSCNLVVAVGLAARQKLRGFPMEGEPTLLLPERSHLGDGSRKAA